VLPPASVRVKRGATVSLSLSLLVAVLAERLLMILLLTQREDYNTLEILRYGFISAQRVTSDGTTRWRLILT
jgi:hypothetical protein